MKILTKVTAFFDRIIEWGGILAAIFIIMIMIGINTDVVSRAITDRSVNFVVEYSVYALLYICFLGAAHLLKREGHVRMDLVLERLQPRTQAVVNAITSILGIIICLVLIRWGISVTMEHIELGLYIRSTTNPPTWPLIAVIPFGSFLLLIQFLRRTVGFVKEWGITPDKNVNNELQT